MVGTVLLVLSEGFDDMAYLSNQVILEEAGNDVIPASKDSGAVKGEASSVMTVSFEEAIRQDQEYKAIIVIGGSRLDEITDLADVLKQQYEGDKLIGAIGSGIEVIRSSGLDVELSADATIIESGKCITLLDPTNCEDFASKFAGIL